MSDGGFSCALASLANDRPVPHFEPRRQAGLGEKRRRLGVNLSEPPSLTPFRSVEEVGNWDLQVPVLQPDARRGCHTVGPVMVYDSTFSGINMAADAMAMALRALAKVGTQIRSTRNVGIAFFPRKSHLTIKSKYAPSQKILLHECCSLTGFHSSDASSKVKSIQCFTWMLAGCRRGGTLFSFTILGECELRKHLVEHQKRESTSLQFHAV